MVRFLNTVMNNANSIFRDDWQEMSTEEALIKVTVLLPVIKHTFNGSQNSILSTITRLWTRWSGFQFTGRTRDISRLQNIQSGSGTHLAS